IEFRHDPPSSASICLKDHLQEMIPKYQKRISHFKQIGSYPGRVFFIRSAYDLENGGPYYWFQENQKVISSKDAQFLKKSLHRLFPFLDFTLVVINYAEENASSIQNIDGILEFKIRKKHKTTDYAILLRKLLKK
ncbi:MAG: hypothetical protein JSS09_05745, partial [Verrucomicrobia bacterium]|nr:hypothetical protein [Verrucomicrobiota bacterium]